MDDELFQMPEKGKQMLGVKVPGSLRRLLDSVVSLWKIRARIRAEAETTDKSKAKEAGQAAEKAVDLSQVCNRLLAAGADKAWADVLKLVGRESIPETDDEWDELEAALLKHDRIDRSRSK